MDEIKVEPVLDHLNGTDPSSLEIKQEPEVKIDQESENESEATESEGEDVTLVVFLEIIRV